MSINEVASIVQMFNEHKRSCPYHKNACRYRDMTEEEFLRLGEYDDNLNTECTLKTMEADKATFIVMSYERHKKLCRDYHLKNKEKINERKKLKYREANPNPRPVGRPKKNSILSNV